MSCGRTQLKADLPILLETRAAVHGALELARESKVVGSSLQSSIVIQTSDAALVATLQRYAPAELSDMFVVSSLAVNEPLPEGAAWHFEQDFAGGKVHVLPPLGEKCERCWRYVAEEGEDICKRCEDIVQQNEAAEGRGVDM